MKTGIELIAAERKRQIDVEGYVAIHDESHDGDELALAAVCYATPGYTRGGLSLTRHKRDNPEDSPDMWPWKEEYWKPTHGDRVRELVKAGALIAAEIDRLQDQHPTK